ncbi:MAG: hypothetical protein U5J78_04915 [Parasphingorhabdus sp.]|nr:hypothetical protein [Parasphingorhabdus sp.]
MRKFEYFACIDWSGARTERPPGIAVATIGRAGPPALLTPNPRWSRPDVLAWLAGHATAGTDMLIGFDLSFGLPFADYGRYFPEWRESPADARALWEMIDRICAPDTHLGAENFVQHPEASRHFRHSRDYVGDLFGGGVGRLRLVERHQRETRQCNSQSCFNLVGAAQVGKSSLTGMRLLHQLNGQIAIWPFDPVPDSGPVIIEIYTTIAARAAGLRAGTSKIRDRDALEVALRALDTPLPGALARYDDHSTDALLTAAWMRQAAMREELWNPALLTEDIAQKEGWTFGVI